MAAGYVAVADGIAWPQEIAVLQVVRERLGLSARRERDNA
jgi:tellurite resistance protein